MWAGLAISMRALAAVSTIAELLALSVGIVGTATILFVVRTTATRQSLILS